MSVIINLRCFPKKQLFWSLGSAESENIVLCKRLNFLKNRVSVRNIFTAHNSEVHAPRSNFSFKSPGLSVSSNIYRVLPSVRSTTRTFFESGGADINTNVSKDVVIFEHKKDRLFKMVKYFGLSQMFIWSYLANTSYTCLRDSPIVDDGTRELRWFEKINFGENWIRNGITIICLCMGIGLSGFAVGLAARSVKSIILHKGGRKITLNTYSLFGNGKLTVPLNMVSCSVSRTSDPKHIPLRIKGKRFYYTLDSRGMFPHPVLFDWTAGLKRKI